MTDFIQSAPLRLERPVTAPAAIGRWIAVGAILSSGFNRALNAIYRSRQRHADQEIERYFRDRGIPLTDARDRELSNRLLGGRSWLNTR